MEQLRAEPHRSVIFPSSLDLDQAQTVFRSVIDGWTGKSESNRELLNKAEAIATKIRSSEAVR
jgi:hypothetical protein